MKYIGILLVLLSAFFYSREYTRYMKKRLSECEGFLAFIAHMRIQVGCFLRPTKELSAGFSSEPLSDSGFLYALSECENIYEAYKKTESRLSLSKEERCILETLFSSVGEGYLDDGIKLIDSSFSAMEKLTEKLREECRKNIKLVCAISVTAALGLIIFVI